MTVPAATFNPSSCHWVSSRETGMWLKNLPIRISTHTDVPSNPLGINLGGGGAVVVRGQFEHWQVR